VKNEEILYGVKEEKNILCAIKEEVQLIGHFWRRCCLLRHVIEIKIEDRIEEA
jgi:hypothetical protein